MMSQIRQEPPLIPFPLRSPLFALAEDHSEDSPVPRHAHDSAQLVHATRGVMRVETDDGIWVVPPERAVWVPAFVGHSIRMTGKVAMRTLYLSREIAPIEGRSCCVVQVSPILRAAILRAIDFPNPYPRRGREARLVGVILDEIRAAPTAPLHLAMPEDPRARRVAQAFRAAPADRRPLAAWAAHGASSERTLERLFQREVGVSFSAWQRQARLLRALEVMAAGESVTAAALEVGFETPSAFIAMFRRTMGTTPGKYFRVPSSGIEDESGES